MKVTTTAIIITMLLATSSLADPIIKVAFPEKGSYLYWIDAKGSDGKPLVTPPKRLAGESGDIDLAPASSDGKLQAGELRIYSPKTGNLAVKSLQNLTDKKELTLKEADFDRVGRVQIILKPADGKPDERLESAVVTLTDANSDVFTSVVDPTSEGVAEFRNIAGGMESVSVAYDGGKMTVEMDVPLDRKEVVFTHPIVISADVRTVKVAASPAAASDGKPGTSAPKAQPNRGGLATTIAGIVFLLMVVFIGYVVLRSKGVTFEGSLKKAGVQFPQDAEADAASPGAPPAPAVDPNVCQFCGQTKDANGKCACSLDSASAATAAAAPRLVGTQGPYSGHIFEVTGTELTIGRDIGNAVPLSDDSTSSRRHAKIDRQDGGFAITDLGSSNGTFVNGSRISGTQPLNPGDEVQVGSTKFRFEI